MSRKIAITNNKGGVGKTMTTLNLGAALAQLGKRVLLVDADSQCNLTLECAGSLCEDDPNLHDYLNNDDVAIRPRQIKDNLALLPGSPKLDADSHNIELSIEENAKKATRYLRSILQRVDDDYDFILIDSAPSSGALLVNVIVAADEMIVPVADKFSIIGANKLTEIIKANHKKITGHYLLTKQTIFGVSRQISEKLREETPDSLYQTVIRQCEDLNKAAALSLDIFAFSPRSHGAEDYLALGKEVVG